VFLSITPGIYAWLKSKLTRRADLPLPADKEPALSAK
jgi:hypothetical protein